MRNISYILIVVLLLIKKDINAQIKIIHDSDSVQIATNTDGLNIKPSVTLLKFGVSFDDSVIVYLNNKRIFSRFIKPTATLSPSIEVDLTAPYVRLPLKGKKVELKIFFYNEKFTVKTQLIPGFKYLYVSKQFGKMTYYYKNKEELYQ